MRTIQVISWLLIIFFLGLTQCAEEEQQVSLFEERLTKVKLISKTISTELKGAVTVYGLGGGRFLSFDQDQALARIEAKLRGYRYDVLNTTQIAPINLRERMSENAYNYIDKIDQKLMNAPVPAGGRISGSAKTKATYEETVQYVQYMANEVENEALEDPYLTEDERLEIAYCTSLIYEITPWLISVYGSYFENEVYLNERTKGWVKNLFKTVFNSVVTMLTYVINYTLYGITVGVLTGAVEGAIVGGAIGAFVGFGIGTGCIIQAYTGGGGSCYRCAFCVTDWTNDPCYQPTCPW